MWVIGNYAGRQATSVLDHSGAGIGYIVLEHGGSRMNQTCIAAFRYAGSLPLPHYLEEVRDPQKIAYYEQLRTERQGLHDEPVDELPDNEQIVSAVFSNDSVYPR